MGDDEAGVRWTLGHLERRTCTRTPALMAALKAKRYDVAVDILRFIESTLG